MVDLENNILKTVYTNEIGPLFIYHFNVFHLASTVFISFADYFEILVNIVVYYI